MRDEVGISARDFMPSVTYRWRPALLSRNTDAGKKETFSMIEFNYPRGRLCYDFSAFRCRQGPEPVKDFAPSALAARRHGRR